MKQRSFSSFLLLYLSWLIGLSLLLFWTQSQSEFLDVFGSNLMILVFAGAFLVGCLYFLSYFKKPSFLKALGWIFLYIVSYLIIEGMSIFLVVTLDKTMIDNIGMSSMTSREVLYTLWLVLPYRLWELFSLANVSHFLDLVYAVLIELGFISPLMLLGVKKYCNGNKECV